MWLFEELAKNQGFKVLKFANCRGQPIFDASLIAGVDYDANLVPPNAPDAEQEHEEYEEDSDDDSGSESNEEQEQEIVDHWEKDEEDLEIENDSNQKIHCNYGEMVLDKVNLDDSGDDSGSEDEPGSKDDDDSRSEPGKLRVLKNLRRMKILAQGDQPGPENLLRD